MTYKTLFSNLNARIKYSITSTYVFSQNLTKRWRQGDFFGLFLIILARFLFVILCWALFWEQFYGRKIYVLFSELKKKMQIFTLLEIAIV